MYSDYERDNTSYSFILDWDWYFASRYVNDKSISFATDDSCHQSNDMQRKNRYLSDN